jgi:gliding motility-associated-like protein
MPDGILTFSWLVATAQEGEQYDSILRDGMIGGHWMYRWEDNIEHGDYDVAVVAYWLHSVGGQSVECTDTVWHPVTIVNTFLQFPNLVTPNGDGENDIWGVVNLIEYNEYLRNELWIYDRSGSLVYHVRDIETEGQFWDPNATNSPDGTYYYRFSGQSLYGVVKRNGIIEVLR